MIAGRNLVKEWAFLACKIFNYYLCALISKLWEKENWLNSQKWRRSRTSSNIRIQLSTTCPSR